MNGPVPAQWSLYFGRCNVNDLHRAVVASSGDGVTTWGELDAENHATDVQRRELCASVRIPEFDGTVVRAAGQDVLRGMERNPLHIAAKILRS